MSKLVWEKNDAGKWTQVPYATSKRAERDRLAWSELNRAFAESLESDPKLLSVLNKAGVRVPLGK